MSAKESLEDELCYAYQAAMSANGHILHLQQRSGAYRAICGARIVVVTSKIYSPERDCQRCRTVARMAYRRANGPLSTQRPSGLPADDGRNPGTFASGDVRSSGKNSRKGQNGQDGED